MNLKSVPEEKIIEKIRFDNPWWKSGIIDAFFNTMKRRLYFDMFFPLIKDQQIRRAVVLMGPRRVGKTVMIYHSIQKLIEEGVDPKKICYFSIETPIYNGIALEELFRLARLAVFDEKPEEFYIFFDEIQYLKDWEIHLKSLVDTYRQTKFVVSGSAAAALKLKSNESGAGRFTDFTLPPLTFHEYINLKDLDHLISIAQQKWQDHQVDYYDTLDINELNEHFIDYINFGGYPEVTLSEVIQRDPGRYIRNDIVDKVLLRDLPSLYGIQDIQELNSLFTTIAYNSGNEFTFDALASSSGVSKVTLKRYISYLEAAFLIRVIHRIDKNAKKFKRANFFKIYLTNPSLRSALFSPLAANTDFIGNMVETAIFSQWQHRPEDELHYARWEKGEVDIVGLGRMNQKPIWAVEIKWSNKPFNDPFKLKNLNEFCLKNRLKEVVVTSLDKKGDHVINDVKYHFIPSSIYCYSLGRKIIESRVGS